MGQGYTFAGICKGTTKAGTPCQHFTVYANGYCRQHGGDSTEFMKAHTKKIVEKMIRRHEKWRRRAGLPKRDESESNAT
jgi:hypothetical protein